MKNILQIIIIISLIGCGETYEISELYIQRIPNSSLVIYEYDARSIYNDSHQFGFTIMDSTETVLVSKIKELPISYLSSLPSENIIEAINLVKPKDKFQISKEPIKEYTIEYGKIKIEIKDREKFYGNSNIGCLLQEYEFDSFKETRDSIFLYGISTKRKNLPELMNGFGLKKGNVKLFESNEGKLHRIEVIQLLEVIGEMFKYKYGTSELETVLKDKFVVCTRTYYFTAKKEINIDDFSDYGIFKMKK